MAFAGLRMDWKKLEVTMDSDTSGNMPGAPSRDFMLAARAGSAEKIRQRVRRR